jgi:putative ABC transport system substrate-binding protein
MDAAGRVHILTMNLARLAGFALMLLLSATSAAQPAKVARVGILHPGPDNGRNNINQLYRGLQDLGYVEGRNIVFERRHAAGDEERLKQMAVELVRMKVDVLVAFGPSPTRAAREATTTIPIVMGSIDPVEQGLIASLARPGGNVTGWCMLSTESGEKQLELIREALPQLTRVAVIANPQMPGHGVRMRSLARSAKALGLQLQPIEVAHADAVEPAFEAMARGGAQGFFVVPEPMVIDAQIERIVALAAKHRLPAVYQWRVYVAAGGLMSYGPSLPESVRLWAEYVHKILKGANPADLPVETPRRYELVVNLKTARELGITLPPGILVRADEVVR